MSQAPNPVRGMAVVVGLLVVGALAMVAVARENRRVNPTRYFALAPEAATHREGDVFVTPFPVREPPILSEDGRRLDYTFVGSSELKAGNPCTADYRPIVREGDRQVTVTFEKLTSAERDAELSGILVCTMRGYGRSVSVALAQPLGERRLVQRVKGRRMGQVIPLPACPARRPVVRWVAPAFVAYSDRCTPLIDGDDAHVIWGGGWSFEFSDADPSDKCNISAGLVFGGANTLDWGRSKPDGAMEEAITLRSGPARLVTADSARYMYVRWEEGGQRYQLDYWSSCRKFPERRRAALVRMADSVDPPNSA